MLLTLFSSAAFAEEPARPDYSRDALLKIMALYNDDHREIPKNRHWHFGYVEFRALGMDWRVMYLPSAAPLQGSGPQGAGKLPNPLMFSTRLSPTLPPMFDHDRPWATDREFRKIMKATRKQ